MPLKLASAAIPPGGKIPKNYTCDGANVSPPFAWSGAPQGTQSFLLVCNDPDAPGKTFHHWAAFDIPPDCQALKEGHGAAGLAHGFRQAINDFGKPGYGGPCPPRRDRPHHYHFRLSALSVPSLPVGPSANCAEVMAMAAPNVLEFVELVGLYQR